ncbi:Retrovirus-related Pol polyprotein from transposon 297 [Trametes pubescens]|uniref:Retrovirus-related Pol polyprotein from transposon 297 n=1 Tax=Trametes pubescens TaxID=154538 RepID=A0A1M2VZZ5_TRAPU|nr:Retrovirus-related Pol polyprotein from transposon 297 [Trametes pubescens]
MVNVMDTELWKRIHSRLPATRSSERRLRMANGAIVPSEGNWKGVFEFEGVKVDSSFELFPSKGAWSFLIGKPMLEALRAHHDYSTDTIRVRNHYANATLRNQRGRTWGDNSLKAKGLNLTLDAKMCLVPAADADAGASAKQESAEREITGDSDLEHNNALTHTLQTTTRRQFKVTVEDANEEENNHEAEQELTQRTGREPKPATKRGRATKAMWMAGRRRVTRKWRIQRAEDTERHQRWLATRKKQDAAPNEDQQDELYVGPDTPEQELQDAEDLYEIPVNAVSSVTDETDSIFTRTTEPFKEARVQAIVDAVQLGEDLTEEERLEVTALLKEYADCFALSVKEVTPVPGAVHTLNVPTDATFSKRVHQRPLTPPQREYVHKKIDELLAAGAIAQCSPSDVKCIAPITLAHKAHEGDGLTLDELRIRVNEECQAAGMPKAFNIPERPTTENPPATPTVERKWRICQNFGEINRVTEIAPMPQGDIRQKQQNVSGHRWVSTFDFASGFYAVTLAEESRPYTCFYIEGRGYFWCIKMPFGLTGAPATFAHMTALHLHDLLGDGTMELFVDDGAAAGDNFSELMGKLRRILSRIRTSGLSLSPSKCKWFMTETVFAGAAVGPKGVAPDTAKLTAVVDWKRPEDALNLGSFLGLTSHFRDLIKDYARVEAPLRDLLRNNQCFDGPGGMEHLSC